MYTRTRTIVNVKSFKNVKKRKKKGKKKDYEGRIKSPMCALGAGDAYIYKYIYIIPFYLRFYNIYTRAANHWAKTDLFVFLLNSCAKCFILFDMCFYQFFFFFFFFKTTTLARNSCVVAFSTVLYFLCSISLRSRMEDSTLDQTAHFVLYERTVTRERRTEEQRNRKKIMEQLSLY